MVLNTTGTKLYATNQAAGAVIVCDVNQSDATLSNCVAAGIGFGNNTSGIVINKADTFAYVTTLFGGVTLW